MRRLGIIINGLLMLSTCHAGKKAVFEGTSVIKKKVVLIPWSVYIDHE
jgi:hypothetical protein